MTTARKTKPTCAVCGDTFAAARYRLGLRLCLLCGEDAARTERKSWCVVQEYGKGPYQFITQTTAPTTLKQTNQKHIRT